MTSTMKSEPLLSVVKTSTSAGGVASAVIVLTGVAPPRAAACGAGDSALATPLDVASAAAPAKAPRFRNCRRARSRDFLDPAILKTSFTGGGAPPPPRTDADASPRIRMSSARHGRRRLLLSTGGGAPPRRETLMPRLGFASPRLGTPPQRGCHAGRPGMAAGACFSLLAAGLTPAAH